MAGCKKSLSSMIMGRGEDDGRRGCEKQHTTLVGGLVSKFGVWGYGEMDGRTKGISRQVGLLLDRGMLLTRGTWEWFPIPEQVLLAENVDKLPEGNDSTEK